MKKRNAVSLILGLFLFSFGIHNIDNSWNLHTVKEQTGIQFVDRSIGNIHFDEFQLYASGLFLTIIGYLTSCFSCLEIREQSKEKKKEFDLMDQFYL